jgi:hypothetical protein
MWRFYPPGGEDISRKRTSIPETKLSAFYKPMADLLISVLDMFSLTYVQRVSTEKCRFFASIRFCFEAN